MYNLEIILESYTYRYNKMFIANIKNHPNI